MAHNAQPLVHPLAVYFCRRYQYAPFPSAVRGLYGLLYGVSGKGQWASTQAWGSMMRTLPDFRATVSTGRLFAPPAGWPSDWPQDWPEHVTPLVMLRAFGSRGVVDGDAQHTFWTNFEGMPEAVAYWHGYPLARVETTLAARAARTMLRQPQFLIFAYNVETRTLPRLDVSPFVAAMAQQQVALDPLSATDPQVKLALPQWVWYPETLKSMAQPFDPLRTRAPDLVKRKGQVVLPFQEGLFPEKTPGPMPTDPWKRPFDPLVDLSEAVRYP